MFAAVPKRGLETRQKRSKSPVAPDFGVLGPLEVRAQGRPLPLGGPKQRALLALFLLHANEVVSRDRLVEGVWGERPPSTIGAALNVYLSKLRKLLGAEGAGAALVTCPHGYMLRLEPERLDLHRFEQLVREGTEARAAGNPELGETRLEEGLALWRGPPLDDLAHVPFAAPWIARLDELRLSALEETIEAGLALGRHSDLVPELTALVGEHPLRERLRGQLMLALYRAGRQSDALQAYREGRRLLAEELGIDPGPELQRLEREILVQDPSLAPPGRPSAAAGLRRSRAVPRRVLLGALAAIVGASVAVPLLVLGRGEEGARLASARDEVAVVAPEENKIVAHVPVGSSPTLIREGDGSVWVADRTDQTVTQIDPESRAVVRTVGIGFRPDDLAAADGAVWAVSKDEGVLAKVSYGRSSGRFERAGFAGFDRIALDDEAVWLCGARKLIRVDPATGRVEHRADMPVELNELAVGKDAVWAVSGPAAAVLRIDSSTGLVTDRIPIVTHPDESSPYPIGIAADEQFVWVLNGRTATVTKIDADLRGIVATVPLGGGRGPLGLAAGEGAVWVSSWDDGSVTRIDAETNAVTSIAVAPHDRRTDVTVAGGLVWVSVDET
jgi:DNA-binding SARP family transcriptional activator/DNA-binding beta-propeller fold protein YncE